MGMKPCAHGLRSVVSGTSLGARMRTEPFAPTCTRASKRLTGTLAVALLVVLGIPSCFTSAEGRRPEGSELYYPTGLLVSPGGTTLYVANSDFDLRFSGGSVQAVDLSALRGAVRPIADALATGTGAEASCALGGRAVNASPWLHPGPCSPFAFSPFVRNSTLIGAFASGLLLVHRTSPVDAEGARLFVPVRGDPSITYLDVDDDRPDPTGAVPAVGFRLDCAVDGNGFCGTQHRLGQDRDRTLRGIQLPADPVGIAATSDGVAVVSAHQTQQAASLVINDWDGVPWLSYFTSSLPTGPTEVAAIPTPALAAAAKAEADQLGYDFQYRDGFLVTFRAAAEIDLLHYVPDSGAVPPRPFLVRAGVTTITANVSNFDSRGIVVLDDQRKACEQSCGTPADLGCLWGCAEIPIQVFAANRNPASLLIGELTAVVDKTTVEVAGEAEPVDVPSGISESLWFYDSVPLAFGASRLELGHVIGPDGTPEPRVFAMCFDSRVVFIFDPVRNRMETAVRTGRGPHDVGVDTGTHGDGEPYSYLYVGHFTDSYIGVVDLDLRRPLTYGQMFATVGIPRSPQETK